MADRAENISAAMRLLKAVAGELRDLAEDTARFGESLADHSNPAGSSTSIRLLQKFDLFTQSLQAHAVLIDNLSGKLDEGSMNKAQLDEMLRHVPFFSVRERLRAVVDGVDAAPEPDTSQDDWFLGD